MILQILADRQVGNERRCRSSRKCSAGPIPESIRICGVLNVPAATITSRSRLACNIAPAATYSMPVARVPSQRDARDVGVGRDGEFRSPPRRLEERVRRRRAAAVANGVLAATEPFLLFAVVIGRSADSRGLWRLRSTLVERIVGLRANSVPSGPAAAAPRVLAASRKGLAASEIGQHVGVGPADARPFAPSGRSRRDCRAYRP